MRYAAVFYSSEVAKIVLNRKTNDSRLKLKLMLQV